MKITVIDGMPLPLNSMVSRPGECGETIVDYATDRMHDDGRDPGPSQPGRH